MRFDFSPLHRTTVGFDRVFDILDNAARLERVQNWPPYDVERTGEDRYRIVMAVVGFSTGEIEVMAKPNLLVVTGRKTDREDQAQVLHCGIATRPFRQSFELADHVKVSDAALADGLLTIELVRELPEAMKPRRIEITSGRTQKAIEHVKAA